MSPSSSTIITVALRVASNLGSACLSPPSKGAGLAAPGDAPPGWEAFSVSDCGLVCIEYTEVMGARVDGHQMALLKHSRQRPTRWKAMVKPVTARVFRALCGRRAGWRLRSRGQARQAGTRGVRAGPRARAGAGPGLEPQAAAWPPGLGPPAGADPSPSLARRAARAIMTKAQPLNIISMPNNSPTTHKALVGN